MLKLGGSRLFPKRKLRIFQVITPTTPYSSKSTGRRKRSGVFSSSSSRQAVKVGKPGPGQAGRRQGAGAGHRGQGRVARFHFEVFKA